MEANARLSNPATPGASMFVDQQSCAALGGRLPSFGELRGAWLEQKIAAGGLEFTGDYYTNDADTIPFTVGYVTPNDVVLQRRAVDATLGSAGPDHFRCVFGP
jgi:hypothetical protein